MKVSGRMKVFGRGMNYGLGDVEERGIVIGVDEMVEGVWND